MNKLPMLSTYRLLNSPNDTTSSDSLSVPQTHSCSDLLNLWSLLFLLPGTLFPEHSSDCFPPLIIQVSFEMSLIQKCPSLMDSKVASFCHYLSHHCFKFLVSSLSIRTVSVPITKTVINKIYTAIHQMELHALIIRG